MLAEVEGYVEGKIGRLHRRVYMLADDTGPLL